MLVETDQLAGWMNHHESRSADGWLCHVAAPRFNRVRQRHVLRPPEFPGGLDGFLDGDEEFVKWWEGHWIGDRAVRCFRTAAAVGRRLSSACRSSMPPEPRCRKARSPTNRGTGRLPWPTERCRPAPRVACTRGFDTSPAGFRPA